MSSRSQAVQSLLTLLTFATLPLFAACGLSPTGPASSVLVVTSTTGASLDADGYGVSVAGGVGKAIGIWGTTTLDVQDVALVTLTGVAANCTLAGGAVRRVPAVERPVVRFDVECAYVPRSLAFATDRDGNAEIYGVRPDGSGLVRLTAHTAEDWDPSWSPDGASLAFMQAEVVYRMDAGGTRRQWVAEGWNPAWSPDGESVAITVYEDDADAWSWPTPAVWVTRVDGTRIDRVTESGFAASLPAWSPDGSMLAFAGWDASDSDIWVIDADGANPKALTTHPAADLYAVWSPDGRRIAFTTDRDGNSEIYVMDADGSDLVNLTRHAASDTDPVWSPDGTRIAFVTDRDGNQEIYVMDADGSGATNLTNHPADDRDPAWAPRAPSNP